MGNYKQTSINLRPDQMEYMDDESINTSELIRKLIDQYVDGGADTSGLELKLKELRARRDEIDMEREHIETQIDEVRAAIEDNERRQQAIQEVGGALMAETHNRFSAYAPTQLRGNQAFTRWAMENDITVSELRKQYQEYRAALGDA
jgi:chromosome segregation ATPase